MSKTNEVIKLAHSKGYRISSQGEAVGLKGKILRLKNIGRKDYPYLGFNVVFEDKRFPLGVHLLQAYQKFGDGMFQPGIQVRHLNNNSADNSRRNIGLGTPSQNAYDRPEIERKKHAAKVNQKLTVHLITVLRADHQNGLSYNELSEKYQLGKSTLSYYLSKTAKRQSFSFPID